MLGLGPPPTGMEPTHIRIGAIAVTVRGEPGDCRAAIETCLRSL